MSGIIAHTGAEDALSGPRTCRILPPCPNHTPALQPGGNQGGGPKPGRCGQIGQPCKFGQHCCTNTCLNGYCACPDGTNLCPGSGACLVGCSDGKVFDPATCTCECVETTCCSCRPSSGDGGFCSTTFAAFDDCDYACLEAAGTGGYTVEFAGGPGETGVCDPTTTYGCRITCDETP